jgi:sugar O-acyltransferase (sialic acid O-acetyltransferase NeuD family)
MEESKVVIYGSGGFAEYVSYVLSQDSVHTVSAFCVEAKYKTEPVLGGLPVVDFETLEQTFLSDECRLFVAVGNNWVRERVFETAKRRGYSCISHLSSKATLWEDLKFGENVFISEGSIIQPFVSIGDNTLVIGSRIGHHSTIGNHVLLSGSCLAGNVTIEDNSFLGLNSSVQHNTTIGRNNIVGMGCTIFKDTNEDEVYSSEKATNRRRASSERFRERYLR